MEMKAVGKRMSPRNRMKRSRWSKLNEEELRDASISKAREHLFSNWKDQTHSLYLLYNKQRNSCDSQHLECAWRKSNGGGIICSAEGGQRRKKVHSDLPPLNVFGGIWRSFGGVVKVCTAVIVYVRVASLLAKPASTQSQ